MLTIIPNDGVIKGIFTEAPQQLGIWGFWVSQVRIFRLQDCTCAFIQK